MKTLHQIEKLLGIKLEKKRLGDEYDPHQKNTYSGTEEHVDRLRLDDLEIQDLAALFAISGELSALSIVNSSIPNFSDLLVCNPYYLTLEGVKIRSNACTIQGKLPGHLKLLNMHVDARALNCFAKSKIGGFRQVEFHNCHIDNIQYIGTIPQISYLILDKITFSYEPLETEIRSGIYRMSVYHSKLENVSFLPFKKDLSHIRFGSCVIGTLSGLEELPNLSGIAISSDTRVLDTTLLSNPFRRNIVCVVFPVKKPVDLVHVLPLQKYITSLELDDFKGDALPHLKQFKRLKHLVFSGGSINLEVFLPIASQIQSVAMNRAQFFHHECLTKFKNLISFELTNFSKGKKALQTYARIYPLKQQLKTLEIYDVNKIQDAHLLAEFTALESLKLNVFPAECADQLLQLKNLKRLQISLDSRKKRVLHLAQLTQLEHLILDTDLPFTGLEQLHRLKSLQLGSDYGETDIDVNALPGIKSLERLSITTYSQRISDLSRFPNLKHLRIKGCQELVLKTMRKLEVLDLDNASLQDFDHFEIQPRLKKLNLSSQNAGIRLKGLHKFPDLRVLSLMEADVDDISDLEPLKKLEILDLYYTSVSDVRVINSLPNMKEVNLATHSDADLESQLDRPEIAVYVGLPTLYLSIWEKDDFGI